MNIQQINRQIERQARQIAELANTKLPRMAGKMAKDFFDDSFRKGGFTNGGFKAWPATKRQLQGGKSASSKYGPLLSQHPHLSRSIGYRAGSAEVLIYNDVPYASIHNEGGTVQPTVTPKMRKYAWARYYEETGQKKKKKGAKADTKTKKKTDKKKTDKPKKQAPPEAQKWKALALTKKKKLKVKIPQRQFIGPSKELEELIQKKIETEIEKIIKL